MNEKNNGTSTPSAPASTPAPSATSTEVQPYEFPRVKDVGGTVVQYKFGDKVEVLRISDTETVSMDAYWFTSPHILKLKKIKPAIGSLNKLKVKTPEGGEFTQQWFNDNVRDPFHKVLKYAARQSLEKGKPVSLAFTRRVVGDETVTTAKHGFEFVTKLAAPATVAASAVKALADQAAASAAAATAQSGTRAKRQKAKKGIVPVVANADVAAKLESIVKENQRPGETMLESAERLQAAAAAADALMGTK